MPKQNDMKYWNIPVTPYLTDVLEKAVELGFHVSKVDLVRCVIREKLSNMGLKEELEIILADLKHQTELEKKPVIHERNRYETSQK